MFEINVYSRFLYKILILNNFFFYKNPFFLINYIIIKNCFFLFNCLLNNKFKKKLIFFFLKKSYKHRYVWSFKKPKFYKIKFKFKLKIKFLKKPTKVKTSKIIKLKRLTGLFKRRTNLRSTTLKKRSLIFNLILKNKLKKKKYWFWKKKKFTNYRINCIDLKKKKKLIIFDNRKIIKFFLKNKSLKKQNKLSSYIINLLNFDSKNLINLFEFRINVILIKSQYFSNLEDSNFFIKNGFISINGKTEFNINSVVLRNDVIKINNRSQYYLFYRNKINKSLFSLKKLNWAFYKFKKKKRKNKFFSKIYHWINSTVHFGFDIPFFLEIDYINLTIIVLFKPLNIVNYNSLKYLNFYLIRLYNWFYIV